MSKLLDALNLAKYKAGKPSQGAPADLSTVEAKAQLRSPQSIVAAIKAKRAQPQAQPTDELLEPELEPELSDEIELPEQQQAKPDRRAVLERIFSK